MQNLISNTQSGFLTDRFIGENTRLVYNIMSYTEEMRIDGLLMLIDFEKAFDSISWRFLNKVLKFFNFGDTIRKWISILNYDITATVTQCGHLSKFFPIERGCRQGDPIAPYLFILGGQILFLMIFHNHDIKGIVLENEEYKISQFADDTTLILDGSEDSLQAALNTIEIFGSMSGLMMNKDKTKIIWIGRKKHSKDKLNTTQKLEWGDTEFDLLGIHFSINLQDMQQANYLKYTNQIIQILDHWSKRYLTPLGKITIVKTFVLGKLIHLFSSLPNPDNQIIHQLNTLIFNFIWDNKPEKVKRIQLASDYLQGGLKMVNLENFINSLKITWLRRLLTSMQTPWITLFETTISKSSDITQLGDIYLKGLINKTKNTFWKDTLSAWIQMHTKSKPKSIKDVKAMPIWLNSEISNYPLHIKPWHKKGIVYIDDLTGRENKILSMNEIIEKFQVQPIDYLTYYRLKTLINNSLSARENDQISGIEILTLPFKPFHLQIVLRDRKGIKNIYKIINCNQNVLHKNHKMEL